MVKKKIIALLLMMVMCVSVLTGCNLWERNAKLYYEATVVNITYADGTKDKITKRELLTAYNSYGYNYVQNYGYSAKKAIETTIDTIIDNYLTRKAVKDHYKQVGEDMFNERETTYLWNKTYDAVYSNLQAYLEGYKSAEDSQEESSSNASVFKDYVSSVYLDEDLVIRKNTPATTIRDTYEAKYENSVAYDFELLKDGEYVFQELMYDKLNSLTTTGSDTSKRDWKNAFAKYISIIKDNYSYMKKSDKEWIIFDCNRVYEILKNNYIVEKYEVIFNEAEYGEENRDRSATQTADVLKAYAKRVRVDYTTYKLQNDVEGFAKNMLDDFGNVDYYLNNGSNYFFIAPIKINLASGDADRLADLEEQKDYCSESEYEEQKAAIFDTTRDLVNVRNAETGEIENHISVASLVSTLGSHMSVESFRDYFYLYNEEDTYKNADYNAVFGVGASGEVLAKDTYSTDAIKDAIKALYNNGQAEIGDISSLVQVDDGWYIFYFAGYVENVFENVDENFTLANESQIAKLQTRKLNIFSSKTLFDVIYNENAGGDGFTTFQNMNIARLRSDAKKIEIVTNNVKDLY